MKKKVCWILTILIMVSCGGSSGGSSKKKSDSQDPTIERGDLVFIKGSETLGIGIKYSETNDVYLDCKSSSFFGKLPTWSRKILVAFGYTYVSEICQACTKAVFKCDPGDTIEITGAMVYDATNPSTTPSSPSDQEANKPGDAYTTTNIATCGSEGYLERNFDNADANNSNLKITYTNTTNGDTDTEYLDCF